MSGLVLVTSPCNKSRRQVPLCELAILLKNLVAARDS